jgi:hypothetical protein
MSHDCPAPDCTVPCNVGILACPQHWRMLPRDLKRAVMDAWRRRAWGDHATARQAAVKWWEAHL